MRVAQRHLESGDTEQAKTVYEAVAQKGSKNYRDLALIMVSRLSPDTSPKDTLKSIKKRSIWYPHAALEIAAYEASNNNYEAALETLNTIIKTDAAPESLKQKASALEHLYTIQMSKAQIAEKK